MTVQPTLTPHSAAIATMYGGSRLYGTAVAGSDTDVKEVLLPDARQILLQRVPSPSSTTTKRDAASKNDAGDVDVERFCLHHFLRLVTQGQTVALEMLFTPPELHLAPPAPAWERVLAARGALLHRGSAAFVSYCRHQAAKYGLKGSRLATLRAIVAFLEQHPRHAPLASLAAELTAWVARHLGNDPARPLAAIDDQHLDVGGRKAPLGASIGFALGVYAPALTAYGARAQAAERAQGIDWKALMHAVRVAAQACELLTTGHMTFPRPERALLLRIRAGKLPYAEVAEHIEAGLAAVEQAAAASPLPPAPDQALADFLVVAAYGEVVAAARR